MQKDIGIKDIEGYEGIYAITSCGQVWSYKRKKFVSRWHNGTPYLLVTLHKNGKKKNKRIHCLVAQAYIPNPDAEHLTKVDHKNGNPNDNYVNNLQWADNHINYCNRKNNIPVMDIITCEIYCSLAGAVKSTGIKRKQIIKDCDNYRDTGEATRFVYFGGLSKEEMEKFIQDYFIRQNNNFPETDMRQGA